MRLTREGIAVVEGDSMLSQQIIDQGRLDVEPIPDLIRQLDEFIPIGGAVADIGACLGDHTIAYARKVGTGGRVYAFEPNSPSLECLRYNLRQYPQVVIWGDALGSGPTTCSMIVDPHQPANLGMATVTKGLDVIVRTLDSVSRGWPRLDFVKIDVEGMEPEVLRGAQDTIRRHRPVIMLEVNDYALRKHGSTYADIYGLLDLWGYGIIPVMDKSTTDHAERFAQPEIDIVAIPIDRIKRACYRLTPAE